MNKALKKIYKGFILRYIEDKYLTNKEWFVVKIEIEQARIGLWLNLPNQQNTQLVKNSELILQTYKKILPYVE